VGCYAGRLGLAVGDVIINMKCYDISEKSILKIEYINIMCTPCRERAAAPHRFGLCWIGSVTGAQPDILPREWPASAAAKPQEDYESLLSSTERVGQALCPVCCGRVGWGGGGGRGGGATG
jgi:hypothetical protein